MKTPQCHSMKLQPEPFKEIRSGNKTIELRLNDEKRQKISVGDIIEFISTEDAKETLRTEVLHLYHFDSFDELYKNLPLLKCGYSEENIITAKPEDMEEYYPKEKQQQYGVVGIEIRALQK